LILVSEPKLLGSKSLKPHTLDLNA